MPHPIANLSTLVFDDVEDEGRYTSRRACFSAGIGARQLGYNLSELPPGKAQCPFHAHRAEEEMFLILEGEGELRFGDQRHPIRAMDVIACPTGGPETAHQIINTGATPMRYLALSTRAAVEVCEYPDSGKLGVFARAPGAEPLRALHCAEAAVDYYHREDTTDPRPAPGAAG